MSWAQEEWKDGLAPNVLHKIDQLERQTEQLRKESQQRRFQADTLEQSLRKQKKAVEDERLTNSELKSDLQALTRTNCDLDQKLARHENDQSRQLAAERSTVGSLKSQNVAAQELLKKREDEARRLAARCDELTADLDMRDEELANTTGNVDKLTEQLTNSKNELRRERESSASRSTDLEKMNSNLVNDLTKLQEELQLEKSNSEVQQNKNEELAQRLAKRSTLESELSEECEGHKSALANVTREHEELKRAYDQTSLECMSATDSVRSLQARLEASEQLCTEAASEIGPLCDQLSTHQQQIDSLTVERDDLLEHSNAAQALLEQLEEARMDSELRYNDLLATVEAQDTETQQTASIDALPLSNDGELQCVLGDKENVSTQLEGEVQKVKTLRDDNESLLSRLEQACEQLSSVSAELSASNENSTRLEHDLSQQTEQLSLASTALEEKDEQLQEVSEKLGAKLADVKAKLDGAELLLANKSSQFVQAQARITDLNGRLQLQDQEHRDERENLLKDLEKLETQSQHVDALQEQCKQAQRELDQWRRLAKDHEEARKSLAIERDELAASFEDSAGSSRDLQEQLAVTKSSLDAVSSDCARLQDRVKQHEESAARASVHTSELSAKCEQFDQAVAELQDLKAVACAEVVLIKSNLETAMNLLEAERSQVSALESEKHEADTANAERQQRISQLEDSLSGHQQAADEAKAALSAQLQQQAEALAGLERARAEDDTQRNQHVEEMSSQVAQAQASASDLTGQLACAHASIEDLHRQLDAAKEENLAVSGQASAWLEQTSLKDTEVEQLQSVQSNLQVEVVAARDTLQQKEADLADCMSQLAASQEQHLRLTNAVACHAEVESNLQERLNELTAQRDNAMAAAQASLEDSAQQVLASETSRAQVSTDLASARGSLDSIVGQRDQLLEECAQLKALVANQEEENARLAAESNDLADECASSSETISELKEKLDVTQAMLTREEACGRLASTMIETEQARVQQLEQEQQQTAIEATTLASQVHELQDSASQLQQSAEAAEQTLSEQARTHSQAVAKLEQQRVEESAQQQLQIDALSSDVSDTRRTVQELMDERSLSAGQLEDVQQQLGVATEEKQLISCQVSSLLDELAEKDEILSRVQSENCDIAGRLASSADAISHQAKELVSATSQLTALQEECTDLKENALHSSESDAALSHQLGELSAEKANLLTSLDAAKDQREQLREQLVSSQTEAAGLGRELVAVQESLTAVSAERDHLDGERDQLRSSLASEQESRTEARNQCEALATQHDALSQAVAELQLQLSAAEALVSQEQDNAASAAQLLDVERTRLLSAEEEKVRLSDLASQYQSDIGELEGDVIAKQLAVDEAATALSKKERLHNEEISEIQRTMSEGDSERCQQIQKLSTDLADAQAVASDVTERLSAADNLVNTLQQQLKTMEEEKQNVISRIASLDTAMLREGDAMSTLQAEHSVLESELVKANESLRMKESALASIDIQLHEAQATCVCLTEEATQRQASESALEARVTELLSERDSAAASLDSAGKSCSQLEQQLQQSQAMEHQLRDDLTCARESLHHTGGEVTDVRAQLLSSEHSVQQLQGSVAELQSNLSTGHGAWDMAKQAIERDLADAEQARDDWCSKCNQAVASVIELQNQLEAAKTACEDSQCEIGALGERLSSVEHKLTSALNENVSLQQEYEHREVSRASLEEKISVSSSQCDALASQCQEYRMAALELEEKLSVSESTAAHEKSNSLVTLQLLEEQKASSSNLAQQNDRVSGQAADLQSRITKLELVTSEQQCALDEAATVLSEKERLHNEEMSGIQRSMSEGDSERCQQIQKLSTDLADAQAVASDVTERLSAADNLVNTLQQQLKTMEEEKQNVISRIASLDTAMLREGDAMSTLQAEHSVLESELVKANESLRMKESALASIERQLTESEEEKTRMEGECAGHMDLLDSLRSQANKLQSNLSASETCIDRVTHMLEEVRQDGKVAGEAWELERHGLAEQIAEAELARKELSEQQSNAEARIAELCSERDSVVTSLDTARTSCSQLEQQVQQSQAIDHLLRDDLQTAKTACEDSQCEIGALSERLSSVEHELASALNENVSLQQEYEQREVSRASLEEKISVSSSQCDALASQCQEYRMAALELEEKLSVSESTAAQTTGLQSRIIELELLTSEQQCAIEEAEATISVKERQHGEEVSEIQRSMSEGDSERCQQIQKLSTDLADAQAVASDVTERLSAADNLVNTLQQRLKTMEEEKQNVISRIASLDTAMLREGDAMSTLQAEHSVLESELVKANESLGMKESALASIERQLTESEEEKTRMEGECAGHMDLLDSLRSQANELQSKLSASETCVSRATHLIEEVRHDGNVAEEAWELERHGLTERLSEAELACKELSEQQSKAEARITELSALQAEHNTLQGQVTELCSERDRVVASLNSARTSCSEIEQRLQQSQAMEHQLRDDLTCARESLHDTGGEVTDVRAQLLSSEHSVQQLQGSVAELQSNLSTGHGAWDMAKQAIERDLADAEQARDDWCSKCNQAVASVIELQNQLEAAKTACEDSQCEIGTLGERLSSVEHKLASALDEKVTLQQEYEQREVSRASLEEKISVSSSQCDALASQCQEYRMAALELEEKLSISESTETQAADLRRRVTELESVTNEQRCMIDEAEATISVKERQHDEEVSEIQRTMSEEDSERCQQIQELSADLADAQSIASDVTERLSAADNLVHVLQQQLKTMEEEKQNVISRIASLDTAMLREGDAMSTLQAEHSVLESELVKANESLGMKGSALASIERQLTESEEEKTRMEAECAGHMDLLDSLRSQANELQSKLSASETCVSRATHLIEEVRHDGNVAEEAWELERHGLTERLSEAELGRKELSEQQSKAEARIAELSTLLEAAGSSSAERSEEIGILREQVSAVEQEVNVLTQHRDRLQQSHDSLQASLTSQEEVTAEAREWYAAEVAELKEKLSCGQPDLVQALAGIDSAMRLVQSEREQASLLERANGELSSQISELREQVSELEHAADGHQQAMEGAKAALLDIEEVHGEAMSTLKQTMSAEEQQRREQMDTLSSELSEAQDTVRNMTEQLSAAELSAGDLRQALNGIEQEKEILSQQVSSVTAEMATTEEQIDELLRRQSTLMETTEEQVSGLEQENGQLTIKMNDLRQVLDGIQQEREELNTHVSSLTAEMSAKEAEISQLESLHTTFVEQHESADRDLLSKAEERTSVLEQEKCELSSQVSELREQVSELEHAADGLRQTGEEAKTALLEMEGVHGEAISTLRQTMSAEEQRRHEQMDTLSSELSEAQDTVQNLTEQLSAAELSAGDLRQALNGIEQEKEMLSQQVSSVIADISTKEEQIQELSLQRSTLSEVTQEQVSVLECANGDLSSQISELREQVSELEHAADGLRQTEEEAKTALLEMEGVHGEAISTLRQTMSAEEQQRRERMDTLSSELSEAQDTVRNMTEQLSAAELSAGDLRQALNGIEQEKEMLSQQVSSVTAEMATKEEQIDELLQRQNTLMETTEEQVSVLEQENGQLTTKMNDLRQVLDGIQQEREELNTQVSSLTAEMSAKEAEISQLESLHATFVEQHESADRDLLSKAEERTSVLEQEKCELSSQISELREQVSELEHAADGLRQTGEEAKSALLEMEGVHSEAISTLRQTMSAEEQQRHEQMDTLSSELSEAQYTVRNMTEKLSAAELSAGDLRQALNGIEQEKEMLSQQVSSVTAEMATKEEQIDELLQRQNTLMETTEEQVSVLEQENSQLTTKMNDLRQVLDGIQQEREELNTQVSSLTAEMSAKEAEISQLTSEHSALVKTCDSTDRDLLSKAEALVDKLTTELFEVHEKCSELSSERDAILGKLTELQTTPQSDAEQQRHRHEQALAAVQDELEQLRAALREKDAQLDAERLQVVEAAQAYIAEREAELAAAAQQQQSSSKAGDSAAAWQARAEEAEVAQSQLRHELQKERETREALLASADEQAVHPGLSGRRGSDNTDKLEKLQSRCLLLEKELDAANTAFKMARQDVADKLQASKSRISLLEEEVAGLCASLKEAQQENDCMSESFAALRAEKATLEAVQADASRATAALVDMEQELKRQAGENVELRSEVTMLQQRCSELKNNATARRKSVLRERDDLVAALRDRESKDASLVLELRGRCEKLQKEKQDLAVASAKPSENQDLAVASAKPSVATSGSFPQKKQDGPVFASDSAPVAKLESSPVAPATAIKASTLPPPAATATAGTATAATSTTATSTAATAAASVLAAAAAPLTHAQMAAQAQFVVREGMPDTVSLGLLDIPSGVASSPMIVRRTTRATALRGVSGLMGLGQLPMPSGVALTAKPTALPEVVPTMPAPTMPAPAMPAPAMPAPAMPAPAMPAPAMPAPAMPAPAMPAPTGGDSTVKLLSPRRRPRPMKRKNDENAGGLTKKGSTSAQTPTDVPSTSTSTGRSSSTGSSSSVLAEMNLPATRSSRAAASAATRAMAAAATASAASSTVQAKLTSKAAAEQTATTAPTAAAAPTAAGTKAPASSLAPPQTRRSSRRLAAPPAAEPDQCKTQ